MCNLEELLDISCNIVKDTNEIVKNLTTITIYNGSISFNVNQEAVIANPWHYADTMRNLRYLIDKFNMEMAKALISQMNKVKYLLVLENNILNSLTKEDINKYLGQLDSFSNKYSEEVITRVRERIMVREYILEGISISGDKILTPSFLDNYNFYSREIIPCIVNIEVYKRLKGNIKALDNILSFWFVRGLYSLYEKNKFSAMRDNALMEFILFNYNTIPEKVPEIRIDYNSVLNTYYNDDEDNEEYSDYIMNSIYEAIDIIRSIDPFNNDIEEIYELLYNFTLIETLITSLGIEELEEIKSYCEEVINNMNRPYIKLIKKMINNNEKN